MSFQVLRDLLPNKVEHFVACHIGEVKEQFPPIWLKSEKLSFFSLYSLSSFTFALLGCLMLSVFKDNYAIEPVIGIPIEIQAYAMILQSLVTFQADVVMAGGVSKWHDIDRILATINACLIWGNIVYLDWTERLLFLIAVPAGLCCLGNSRVGRRFNDKKRKPCLNAYTKWHSLWHFFMPFTLMNWLCFRQYESYLVKSFVVTVILSSSLCCYYVTWKYPLIFHETL